MLLLFNDRCGIVYYTMKCMGFFDELNVSVVMHSEHDIRFEEGKSVSLNQTAELREFNSRYKVGIYHTYVDIMMVLCFVNR